MQLKTVQERAAEVTKWRRKLQSEQHDHSKTAGFDKNFAFLMKITHKKLAAVQRLSQATRALRKMKANQRKAGKHLQELKTAQVNSPTENVVPSVAKAVQQLAKSSNA